ncbi:unnamed protein product [Paramecium sonneborni]|uniref:Protein kinase domain-containing protein n=1 Tax=Paramecium sonneborni TaxID=65129 RepID=A0A8S1Q7P6_9CILI|nr:unnamed protein product [Paramecium sonneborni]
MIADILQKKDYHFIKIIGKGAFANVYLAENKKKELFAIKVISIDLEESKESEKQLQYFEQEIHIYKNTQNENLVSLIEEFRENHTIYCVFEYCSKGDLNNFLKNCTLNESEIKSIFIEILKGIKYLHSNRIVHRDLKIDNILITENNVVKIADFGFAKYFTQGDILTSYCGTPATMAPEVLNQEKYDYKCDIWSLGVILYYMIYRKYHWNTKIKSLQDLQKELQNFKIIFDDNRFNLSQSGKDLLFRMLESNQQKRIDYDELFSHPWLGGALNDNYRISKIVIKKGFDSKIIGEIASKIRKQKNELLDIIQNLQTLSKNQDAKQLFNNLYDIINKEHQFNLQCEGIIYKQHSQIVDYKVESFQTLQKVYEKIKFEYLDIQPIEQKLMLFLEVYHLSNSLTITLQQKYSQEELDKITQNIQEFEMDQTREDLDKFYKLEVQELDPILRKNVENFFKARCIFNFGTEIQSQHQPFLSQISKEIQQKY